MEYDMKSIYHETTMTGDINKCKLIIGSRPCITNLYSLNVYTILEYTVPAYHRNNPRGWLYGHN